jgi:hypothetical protein
MKPEGPLKYPVFSTGSPKSKFPLSELSSIDDIKPNSDDEIALEESQSLADFPKLHHC